MRQTTNHPDEDLNRDDVDMLQAVLMNVRGSYPDAPYRQADYFEEDLDTEA